MYVVVLVFDSSQYIVKRFRMVLAAANTLIVSSTMWTTVTSVTVTCVAIVPVVIVVVVVVVKHCTLEFSRYTHTGSAGEQTDDGRRSEPSEFLRHPVEMTFFTIEMTNRRFAHTNACSHFGGKHGTSITETN